MQITRQQADDFLAGRLHPEEAESIARYLLQLSEDERDVLLGKTEWDKIAISSASIPDKAAERMDKAVLHLRSKKKRVVSMMLKWSVAAAVALIAWLVWWPPAKK